MSMPNSRSIPVEYIQKCFEYREEEVDGVLQGNVYWKYREDKPKGWNTKYSGKKVGSLDAKGYCCTTLVYNGFRCLLKIHRIVSILNTGHYPVDMIDHIDRNKLNNLIQNLRPANAYLNNLNTPAHSNKPSQYKGVYFNKDMFKWRVQYNFNNKTYHVGYFVDELEAAIAYNKAILKVFNTEYAYMNDISMGYTNQTYPNMPRGWVPEEVEA
jgi:hypothetical protein